MASTRSSCRSAAYGRQPRAAACRPHYSYDVVTAASFHTTARVLHAPCVHFGFSTARRGPLLCCVESASLRAERRGRSVSRKVAALDPFSKFGCGCHCQCVPGAACRAVGGSFVRLRRVHRVNGQGSCACAVRVCAGARCGGSRTETLVEERVYFSLAIRPGYSRH